MKALLFYCIYPFIYLIASLPFPLLYLFSDFLYVILRVSGYRKKVILQNLRNSFPEKPESEIQSIFKSYCHYLCDLILETLKMMTMSEKQVKARCFYKSPEWFDKMRAENKSFIILMGHYGNWEWASPGFSLNSDYQLLVVYHTLSNSYFDRMMSAIRTRFGARVVPMNQTLRDMVANRDKLTATALVADQTAGPENAYWTNFLNQDTAVFTGPEKLAKKFNYPVVYNHVKRTRRGYYEMFPELLFADPGNTSEGEIMEAFTRRLEDDIKKDPALWLWSHRRWKHKRPL
ncbi:MAG: lysophospholipid acyltransferase family protein [Cytophagaceae bacterium]